MSAQTKHLTGGTTRGFPSHGGRCSWPVGALIGECLPRHSSCASGSKGVGSGRLASAVILGHINVGTPSAIANNPAQSGTNPSHYVVPTGAELRLAKSLLFLSKDFSGGSTIFIMSTTIFFV
jgi:hypothetical protein